MEIIKTQMKDLDQVMEIYAYARRFMAEHGNPNQWGTLTPRREQIIEDIQKQKSHICVEKGQILGVFYFAIEEDPTYFVIEGGEWKQKGSYGVVHRIASAGLRKGVGQFCIQWAYDQCKNLRIDTHRDNTVMQNLLAKLGFEYCGIIYIKDGSPRIAYQRYEH